MQRAADNPAATRRGRMAAVDLLTLAAVSTVVLMVSLPCLRDFAVRENERDAQRLLPVLARAARLRAEATPRLDELLVRLPQLGETLRDAHPVPERGAIRHHGYVFELTEPDDTGARSVLARPIDRGRTGLRSFAYHPQLGLLASPADAPGESTGRSTGGLGALDGSGELQHAGWTRLE